ncbi:MAG: glycosyltransferase N-terminal domain-containing protein [Phaeovulum sp.]|uniref:3-deoxy-D-manno-octulosonic acid transferase n=1 Tax=Phaeovulum sp. TaxID=2934796 RepID=UPI0027318275|nr:glycosyltransferase N-terminal domain-containing protein [Phaeovulum sp.]MDP2062249.1 glycosyltransferase N-terminal domain-containing protein [Phaeovulum sp.]
MPHALALWLHLITRRGAVRKVAALPPPMPARPQGDLICLYVTAPEASAAAMQLASELARARPGVTVILAGAEAGAAQPGAACIVPAPAMTVVAARAFLALWHPGLVLLVGAARDIALPAALIAEAAAAGTALMLVEARFVLAASPARLPWFWPRALLRALLTRMDCILVPDQANAAWLAHLGVPADRVELSGSIREPVEPLSCTEAERAALAQQLHSRPVWFAVAVPEAEELAVLEAHEKALLRAHRMLLVLMPQRVERAALLAEAVEARGHHAARRALEEEPEDDVQVLIVEDDSELGLWYRLAPVTWMGGTLLRGGAPRSPLEPAALGSAIVHGPAVAAHADEYARLAEAAACRVASTPAALADAVAELIAPDRVAALARNAWEAISGDAGVAEKIARRALAELDAALVRGAGQT